MYLRSAVKPIETKARWPGLAALIFCVALTLALAIPPGANWILGITRQATQRQPTPPVVTPP